MINSTNYSFANDTLGQLVHISQAKKNMTFICIACNDQMIPVQGNVNRHHFRHTNISCSYESYLHKAAKNAFFDRFNQSYNKPIPLQLERVVRCKSKKKAFLHHANPICTSLISARYNLKTLFSQSFLEKYDEKTGFTPDIMLFNENTASYCYVEIFVSHKCSPNKISSGIPIIEILVRNEDDIKYIQQSDFSTNDENVTTYNFTVKEQTTVICHNKCNLSSHKFELWSCSASGRLNRNVCSFKALSYDELESNNIWSVDLGISEKAQMLINFVKAMDNRTTPPNCLKCNFCDGWNHGKTYCKLKSVHVHYTEARACKHYKVSI